MCKNIPPPVATDIMLLTEIKTRLVYRTAVFDRITHVVDFLVAAQVLAVGRLTRQQEEELRRAGAKVWSTWLKEFGSVREVDIARG